MKKLKLGILGNSKHFITRVLQPLLKSEIVEVYALSSRDINKSKETAGMFGIPKYYGSYDDLLKDKNVDIVFIPLPNNLHAEWIKKSADHNKHIICEKPIAMNAKEASEAITYAKSKGVYIMEAFMYKFHPQWAQVKEMIKFGDLGNIQSIHTAFYYNNTDPKNIRNNKETGGGALYDIGCYAISSARFLLGKEPEKVIGLASIDSTFNTDFLFSGILDFGQTKALFTTGTQSFPYQTVEIHGTGGTIFIEIPFNMFSDTGAEIIIKNPVGTRTVKTEAVNQYLLQFDEFAKAIIENKEPPVSAEDAVLNMKVIDALFKSVASSNWEKV